MAEHTPTTKTGNPASPDSLIDDVMPPNRERPDALVDALLGTQLGNYEILFVLGKGAYGTVYKARDVKLGRHVAIKFLHEFLDARHEAMFLHEAKAIAALGKHPAIVQIYEYSEYQGRNYFVLEFVGSNAGMLLRVNPKGLPIEQAAHIVMNCAEGLAYAHRQGIIHRDVKPANILLELEGGGAKLADFGVARFFDPAAGGRAEGPRGTPGYMAPEIVDGAEGDARSDIFSLAVTFYELLCGRLPFEAPSTTEIMERIRRGEAAPLAERRPELSPAVLAIVDTALAHDPAARFSSADLFASELRRFLRTLKQREETTPALSPADAVRIATPEEVRTIKTRTFKAAEDAKHAGADKLAHELLKAAIEAFRDGEAYERLKQLGAAARHYEGAGEQFAAAERRANEVMEEIRALKAAQNAMDQARTAADTAEAVSLAPETYAAAAEEERIARNTPGLTEATDHYQRAKERYVAAMIQAHRKGESGLGPLRREIEAARRRAEMMRACEYAEEEVASAEDLVTQAQRAVPDFKEVRRLYGAALARFSEALRVTLERKRMQSEKEARPPMIVAGIELVWIPPGSFSMGSADGPENQRPVHTVTLAHGFWMGTSPVTQEQWTQIMVDNPSGFHGPQLPVENVSWEDCQEFLRRLNTRGEGQFRLPTEAEWEYACRAGSTGKWCFGDDPEPLAAYAWCHENAGGRTHPVGEKNPNAWGLHDMHGNVCEWCQDTWQPGYVRAPNDGRAWITKGASDRVARGGSWCIIAPDCGSADRGWYAAPETRTDFMGLRVCREK